MKKAIGIIILGLLVSGNSYAFYNEMLALNVNPPDASCTLKKSNKKILKNLYPKEEHNAAFEDNSFKSIELLVKISLPRIPNKTVVNIICEKDGYVTVVDELKYSRVVDVLGAVISGLMDMPSGVILDLFQYTFGTYILNDNETPAHRINLIKGEGTVVYKHGKIYEGETKNGKYHGEGVLKLSNGTVYKGEFKNGKMHGHGTITFFNGETHKGNFEKNKFIEGYSQSGCIEGNCINGQGTYTFANGNKYVGEWKNGKKHGQGTFTEANGDKYVGELKDNKRHGLGTYTWANGAKYVGEWKDHKEHGQATYTYADGTFLKGIWKDGELVK